MSLPKPITIRVDFDIQQTAPNHYNRIRIQGMRTRLKNKSKATAEEAYEEVGSPVWNVPVTVDVLVRRGRVMDGDNIWASLKCIRDVLFKNAITPDDSDKWVECGTIRQETGKEWSKSPHVLLMIRPRTLSPLDRRLVSATAEALYYRNLAEKHAPSSKTWEELVEWAQNIYLEAAETYLRGSHGR